MSIETLMTNLIAALEANTAALKGTPQAPAQTTTAPAAAPAAPKPTAPAAAKPTAPAAPKPTAPKAPAAAPAVDERYSTAREKMKAVLDDAAKGPNAVRDILSQVGATKLSDVKVEQLDQLLSILDTTLSGTGEAATGMFD